ncbi:hypothetical protein PHET_08335 [Paragonimus heterotremus]|uniref:Uncharacterized protein n=1 Tax=Paragonimus heterotremus TaxID=100268 RepID=A0A8J4WD93_9TREM|nr:hypothetical protein PHET_08335 [Paragonimus heterotremus]
MEPTGHGTSAEVLPFAFSTQELNGFRFPQPPPLDLNRTGYTTGQDVVAYWSRLGVSEPEKTLKHLGFQEEQQIDLKKLMNLLENRAISLIPRDNPVCTAALLTVLNELCLTDRQQREVTEHSEVHLVEQSVLAEQFRQEVSECRSELKRVSDERDRLQSEVDIEKQTEYEEIKQQLEEAIKLANTSSTKDSRLPQNLTTVSEQKNELSQHNARLHDRITQLESEYEKRFYETRSPEEETSLSNLCRNASRISPAKSAEKLACQLEIALKERAALLEYQLELEETLKIQAEQISMLQHRGSTWNLEPDRTDNKDNLPVTGTNARDCEFMVV